MAFRPATCARMSDMENFVADIVSAEKVPHIKGSLPSEVVVQSSKFPSTTSKHRKGSLASKPFATWVGSSSVNAGTPHYYF